MATIGKVVFWCLALATQAAASEHQISGKVIGVSDGDTLTILDTQYTSHRIRLGQIDAPESAQDFGQVSKQSLAALTFGKQALAKCSGLDFFDRPVCQITVDGIDVNAEQVTRGMAWVYPKYAPRKSPLYEFQAIAQTQQRGLWRMANPTPPWNWRREHR